MNSGERRHVATGMGFQRAARLLPPEIAGSLAGPTPPTPASGPPRRNRTCGTRSRASASRAFSSSQSPANVSDSKTTARRSVRPRKAAMALSRFRSAIACSNAGRSRLPSGTRTTATCTSTRPIRSTPSCSARPLRPTTRIAMRWARRSRTRPATTSSCASHSTSTPSPITPRSSVWRAKRPTRAPSSRSIRPPSRSMT